jgi:hypothetical protein
LRYARPSDLRVRRATPHRAQRENKGKPFPRHCPAFISDATLPSRLNLGKLDSDKIHLLHNPNWRHAQIQELYFLVKDYPSQFTFIILEFFFCDYICATSQSSSSARSLFLIVDVSMILWCIQDDIASNERGTSRSASIV